MRKIWEIYACGAVRPQAFVFLANFSEMADLSGKRHAYWNNKVLGKSAIKKGGHFSRGRPFKDEWSVVRLFATFRNTQLANITSIAPKVFVSNKAKQSTIYILLYLFELIEINV